MLSTHRDVLSHLRSLAKNTETLMNFSYNSNEICCFTDNGELVSYDYSFYKHEICGILDCLVEDGYLSYADSHNGFYLTQRGLHPYKIGWKRFKNFLLRSIIVPIVVSALTTLVTLWLKRLLQ